MMKAYIFLPIIAVAVIGIADAIFAWLDLISVYVKLFGNFSFMMDRLYFFEKNSDAAAIHYANTVVVYSAAMFVQTILMLFAGQSARSVVFRLRLHGNISRNVFFAASLFLFLNFTFLALPIGGSSSVGVFATGAFIQPLLAGGLCFVSALLLGLIIFVFIFYSNSARNE